MKRNTPNYIHIPIINLIQAMVAQLEVIKNPRVCQDMNEYGRHQIDPI